MKIESESETVLGVCPHLHYCTITLVQYVKFFFTFFEISFCSALQEILCDDEMTHELRGCDNFTAIIA